MTKEELQLVMDALDNAPARYLDQAAVATHYKALEIVENELKQFNETQLDAKRYQYLTANGNIGERLKNSYDLWDGCDGKPGFDRIIDNAIKETL